MTSASIYIIEDEVIIAEDIKETLYELGYRVAGGATNSEKAIDYLSHHSPDLVLCDICIPGEKDGIEVAEIFSKKKGIPFVFLTSLSDRHTLERAKKVLPLGYLVKPFNEQDLLATIEVALHKHQSQGAKKSLTKEKVDALCASNLTTREYEILMDIKKGLSNVEIVSEKYISLNTVKSHVRNIFAKLHVQNRAGAMHKLIEILSN